MKWSERLFLLSVVSAVLAIGYVLFLETYAHFIPCSLCIFQRVGVIGVGVVNLLAFLHLRFRPSTKAVLIYSAIAMVIAALGLSVALRQIYLQSLPPSEVPACGPGLNFLFKAYPFLDALKIVLQGSGDCAKIQGRFLGLTLADASGLYFVVLVLLNALSLGCGGWTRTRGKQ